MRRLALTHALEGFGDGLVTMSLVGSLFFSVSLEASRSRVLLYLVLTAAPLALVAPLVGPALDRFRSGYRTIIVSSLLARVVLALALARLLLSPGFFPVVFGILLARKAYGLGRTAVTSQLIPEHRQLVAASAHLALTGTAAGGLGTALGGLLLALAGPEVLLAVAAPAFALAAVAGLGLPAPRPAAGAEPPPAMAVAVETVASPELSLSVWAVATTRAASGAVTFLLAYAFKSGGSDNWVFAAALVAAGVGSFAGTAVAGRLHQHLTAERMIALALIGPGVICTIGVGTVGHVSIVAIALAVGLGTSVATRSMESIYGLVPLAARGRVIARSEVRFQVANLVGAAVSVVATPAARPGFAVVAVALVVAGLGYASGIQLSLRGEARRFLLRRHAPGVTMELPLALLQEADRLAELGANRMAICVADSAVRSARAHAGLERSSGGDGDHWYHLRDRVEAVQRGQRVPSPDEAADVLTTAHRLVAELAVRALADPPGGSGRADDDPTGSPPVAGTAQPIRVGQSGAIS
jgi:MFS family permease